MILRNTIRAGLFLLLAGAMAGSANSQSADHIALLTDLQGDVVIARSSGGTLSGKWGTQLFEGDEVKTKASAGASILFSNNQLVTLGQNSSMIIRNGSSSPEAARVIDGPLLADVSGLTMHRTGRGDVAALGVLRSGRSTESVEALAPRNTKVQAPRPEFIWDGPESIEVYRIRVFDENGVIWSGETESRRLVYPADAPPLSPDRDYLWQVEGEEMLESYTSEMASFTVLSPDMRDAVAAWEASLRAQFGDDPDGSNFHFALGSYYAREGLLTSAIASFERIAQRHPDAALPFEILGKLYADIGLKDDAINAFQQAIALEKE